MPDEMTPERALIVLNQCNTDGRIKVDREELKEAVRMASEAIRRRIPMTPFTDCYREYVCSNCKARCLWMAMDYCDGCGQAIDWSEYE